MRVPSDAAGSFLPIRARTHQLKVLTMPKFSSCLPALAAQRQATETSLRAFLAQGDNFDLGVDERGDFAALVASLCRPALFAAKVSISPLASAWRQWQGLTGANLFDSHVCLALPLDELQQAADALEPAGALFQFRISELKGFAPGALGIVELGTGRQSIDVEAGLRAAPSGVQLPALSACFVPRLTIPDAEVLFPGLWESSQTRNTWLWHRIKLYEDWQEQFCPSRRHDYIQIGGWALFVQLGDQSQHIAQVNNDIGDSGSVYLMKTEAGELQAEVQMC